MESILTSIKKLLGIDDSYDVFDADIIMHINSVFTTLNQIGVGPPEGFMIEDETTTWNEYIQGKYNLSAVKSYIYLKVKLLFDPPSNSALIEAYNNQAKEYEWRLNVTAESHTD